MPVLNLSDALYVGSDAVELVYWQGNIIWSAGSFIRLTGRTVAENAANGFTVGVLSVGGTFTGTPVYSLTNNAGGRFAISGSNLNKAGALDYETATSHSITVHVTGITPAATDRPFTILVTDVDDTAPLITSANSASNVENSVLAHALTANEPVTWAIIAGGADNARFEISGSTLRWLGNGTKDFDAPNDANTDNAYIVTVRATDLAGNVSTTQTITVTVTDVDEIAPTITSSSSVSIAENAILTHTLTASETVTWTKTGGADAAAFTLTGNTLTLPAKDYETQAHTWLVQVTATDAAGNATNQTITVTITDVAEGGGGTAGEMFGFFFPLTKAA